MASGSTSQMKSDDFRLFCALCLESYSSIRIPKILSCFHTFCLPCLRTLAEKTKSARHDDGENHEGKEEDEIDEDTKKSAVKETQTTNEVPQEKELEMPKEEQESENNTTSSDRISGEKSVTETAHSLQCPTCRTTITLPDGGVSALQTNFYVTVDVESNTEEAGGGPVVCEMCEEGQQQEAQHFCHNCQQHMCRSCRRLHDLVGGARDHHVEALSYKSAPKLETSAKEKLLCQFHPDQSLCFNCCKCDTAICLHCKLTSHEGHETQDMATAVIQAKGELTGLRARAVKQLQSLEACISRLERDELDLKRQKQEVIHQVGSRYEILMTWAARARDELLEELSAKEQATLNDIRTKKASARFLKGSISSRMARASRTVSLGADIVLMKNELQAALVSDESFEDFQKLADRKEHLAFFTCEAESSLLDLNIMRTYMGQLREADGSDRPSMTFHELVSAVSSLETELKAVKGDSDCPSISSLETELKAVKDGCRTEATFRYTVENISELKEEAWSPPYMGRHFPWEIRTGPSNSQNADSQKSLEFFLFCNTESDSTSWSCQASVELRILNTRPDTKPFCRKFSHLFCCKDNDWGFPTFLSWNELMDPEKGYVKDDKVTLEVHIMADAPHGV